MMRAAKKAHKDSRSAVPEPEPFVAAGDAGHAAAAGRYGHAAAVGDEGQSEASGEGGIACALGKNVTVQAGEKGLLIATYWDEPGQRFRAVVGVIGEGFEPGVAYVVRDGKLVRKEPKP